MSQRFPNVNSLLEYLTVSTNLQYKKKGEIVSTCLPQTDVDILLQTPEWKELGEKLWEIFCWPNDENRVTFTKKRK